MISPRELWSLVKQSVNAWLEDRAPSMGAALAYYTAFSIAPLLIIAIAIAGLVFGRDAAQAAVVGQLQGLLGEAGGNAIAEMLKSTANLGSSIVAIMVGVAALILTATTAFVELQDDLDRIWKAKPRVGSGIINLIRSRLLSFGMVLAIGFLLTVSLVLNAAVAALGDSMLGEAELLLQAITFLGSFAVITALFATIYKVLPNVEIAWEDVWIGAAITALLFEIGKLLIGLYIGKSSVASSFGTAGPFVVLMLWIYYSTQIFLLGAEFTSAHAHRGDAQPLAREDLPHSDPTPVVGAQPVPEEPEPRAAQPGPAAPEVFGSPHWARRLLGVSAAGLLAGLALSRMARGNRSKSR
jgi:membrane protein